MKPIHILAAAVAISVVVFVYKISNEVIHSRGNNNIITSLYAKETHKIIVEEERKLDRIAVIAFMGEAESEARIFLTMLFGAWRFITDRKKELLKPEMYRNSNVIDIVMFCDPGSCEYISSVCTVVKSLKGITSKGNTPNCWAVHQTFKIDVKYPPLNSYIMCMRPDVGELTKHYKYLLRSDYDVFITPSLFLYKTSQKLLFGAGGYSGNFPNARLKEISKKLSMRHQGFHSVGSTWYGETAFFIKAGKVAYNTTRYMYLNEFKPELPGLEGVFDKNPEGNWPKWWRPVSSMYGGEMAVNHMIDNISDKNRGRFDTSSCETKDIWSAMHIHCWHSDCEFQKFRFTKYLNMIMNKQNGIPGPILHLLVENMYGKDISKMNVREFATHIAWYSVGRYLKQWMVKNEEIPELFPHDKKKT